jgi:arginyl-tRNA synthetase
VTPAQLSPAIRASIGDAADHGVPPSAFVPEMLSHEPELALLMALARSWELARQGDPGRLFQHLDRVAETFQTCFAATRITPCGNEPVTDLHRTRLWLAEATRLVLASGLDRLGLTAPEHP